MANLSTSSSLTCTQCGGDLHPDEGQLFVTCSYCGGTVYVDKSRTVFHWYVAPTLDAQQAQAALRRWMSGSQTVKDLDQKAQITGQAFRYFPMWYFRWKQGEKESIALEPAAATAVTELSKLNLPAGDLRKYDAALETESDPPTVPLAAGMDWFHQNHANAQVIEIALVHVPIFMFKYIFKGTSFSAVVDAASATVLANIYPAKDEMPYRLVGGVAALVFLCLATFPVIGAMADRDGGAVAGLLLCSGLGIVAGPLILAWAAWVAARV